MITVTPPPAKANRIPAVQRRAPLMRDAGLVTFLVLVAVIVATLGKPFIEIPGLVDASAHARRSLDLEMFNGFDHPSVSYGPWLNTLGNVVLFIPLGAALAVFGSNLRRFRFGFGGTVLLAVLCSLGIEATQYIFALGFSDIDDLVFNTLGAAMGAGMLLRRNQERQARIMHGLGFLAAGALTVLAGALITGKIG